MPDMTMPHRTTEPTADQIRTLPTAELALKMLASFDGSPNPNNLMRGHEEAHGLNGERDVLFLLTRLSDGWAWLVANALIGPHHRQDPSGWFRVTARGQEVLESRSVSRILAEQRLPEGLHTELLKARDQFRNGEAEIAVFAAMRQVEVRLRNQSGAGNELIGVQLARYALKTDGGPLTDTRLESGEREAMGHLFAGALGAFKNPTSHRVVDFNDPAVAADVILLADLLLRLLDSQAP